MTFRYAVLLAIVAAAVSVSAQAGDKYSARLGWVPIANAREGATITGKGMATATLAGNNGSWSAQGRILPYLEQGNAYNLVRLDIAWDDPVNWNTGVPILKVPVYRCPSEVNDLLRVNSAGADYTAPLNYGFNFGTWLVHNPATRQGGEPQECCGRSR